MSELLLVANAGDSTVSTFRVRPGRPALERIAVSDVGSGCGTFAVDAGRDLVFAAAKGEPPGIDVFALDRDSGTLTHRFRTEVESPMTYLTLAHGGTLLAGASYSGGAAEVFPVQDDGRVGNPTAHVSWPHAHCVAVGDGGKQLYVVSLGADVIAQYKLSPQGQLTPLVPSVAAAPEGSGPRHLVLNAEQTAAFVLTEFSGVALGLSRDPRTGVLTPRAAAPAYAQDRGLSRGVQGADPAAEHRIWGADLHLARDERFLLCSERTASTLSCLPVEDRDQLGHPVCVIDTVAQPRGFVVLADGAHAVVTGERSTEVALVHLGAGGTLSEVGRYETGAGANWARTVPGGQAHRD